MKERPRHYDRKGRPIDLWAWARLSEDFDYKVVKKTRIRDLEVSTVWLGLDHNFMGKGRPIIFESTVFDSNHEEFGSHSRRYTTERLARRGHDQIVKEVLEQQSELDRFNYEINKKETDAPRRPRRSKRGGKARGKP